MRLPLAVIALALVSAPARADSTQAECAYETYTADSTFDRRPCVFSQSQGHVTVVLEDGTEFDFTPSDDAPATYTDADGGTVLRRDDLGAEGNIYITDEGMLSVYW